MTEEEIINRLKNIIEINKSSLSCDIKNGSNIYKDIQKLLDLYSKEKRKTKIKDSYCQLLIDLGYDYDGFNTVDSLKGLIDELVDLAKKAIKNDDKSIEYDGGDNAHYNILYEKIEESE